MIGQDAVATAQAFLDGVGYDAVVLTKLDGDARGGAALSIVQLTGRPIMFASSGEKLEDFDLFHPDRMASRILDLGDMLTLIEQAEKAFDADQTAYAGRAARLRRGLHARGLRRAAVHGPQARADREPARHAARRGQEPGTAVSGQRQGPGPGRGHRPVHDARRSGATRRSSTARAGRASPRAPASPSARSPSWSRTSSRARSRCGPCSAAASRACRPAMGAMARRAAAKSARGKKGKKKPARSGDPRRAAEIARGAGAQGQPTRAHGAPGGAGGLGAGGLGRPGRPARRLPGEHRRRPGQPAARPELPAPRAGQHPRRLPRRNNKRRDKKK